MTLPRDASGKTLEDYPRPSVAVDTAVLTVSEGRLCVLLVKPESTSKEPWRLPGTFLHPGETLADAVRRSLWEKAAVSGLQPAQLHVFDDPKRDNRGWVLSVAHLDVVRVGTIPQTDRTQLVPVGEVPPLPFDHGAIIQFAVEKLRKRYEVAPDPARLLESSEPDASFTMLELRHIHEAVQAQTLLADSFRRAMQSQLVETGRMTEGRRGKPAMLYTLPRAQ